MTITTLHPEHFSPTGDDSVEESVATSVRSRSDRYDPTHEQPWSESDVALFLGISDRQVRVLRREDPTFPPPTRFIGTRPVWLPDHPRAWVAGEDFANKEVPTTLDQQATRAARRGRSSKSERALV